MKKAIIYLRTSSDKQIDNTSLDTQEQISRAYSQTEGLEVVDVKRFEAVSAKETNSLRAAELLEFVKVGQGKFEVLVVFKLDRFARNQEQHHWLRGQLMKMGVVLRSATERIDETPSGRLVEGVLAAVNQYDNEVRIERVKIGLWRRGEEGLWPWQAPSGYYRPKDTGVRLTVSLPDPNCDWAFRNIFDLYSTGTYTYGQLASLMSKKKIKNWQGKTIKFSKQLIDKTLKNPFYVGYLKGKDGKPVKGRHEAIVEMSVWQKCQEVRTGKSNHAINKRLYNHPDFPLRRFVSCSKCSKQLTSCWSKGQAGGRYAYYYCVNRKCERYSKMISKNTLHDSFCDYMRTVKPTDDFVKFFTGVFIERYEERKTDIKGEYSRKLGDVQKLEKEQEWLVEKGKKGIISDALLQKQLEDTDQKLTLAKMSLEETHAEELEVDSLLNHATAFIRTCDLVWYDALFEAKQKYQRLVFPSGVSFDGTVFSNSEIGLPFELITTFATNKSTDVSRTGFEPVTVTLRGYCSTIELAAQK